jgi:hypothetical protein
MPSQQLVRWVEPFAKPIAVVPRMMGIASAFHLRSASYGGQVALGAGADAVSPPILRPRVWSTKGFSRFSMPPEKHVALRE